MAEREVQDIAPNAEATAEASESAEQPEAITALEPSTLPSHSLRADDVTCFLPKMIG